jgi:hypothetical protein
MCGQGKHAKFMTFDEMLDACLAIDELVGVQQRHTAFATRPRHANRRQAGFVDLDDQNRPLSPPAVRLKPSAR